MYSIDTNDREHDSEGMNLSSKSLISSFLVMRVSYQLLFTGFLILVVYYPAFFAGWCRVDDIEIMNRISNIGFKDLDLIFVPGFKEGVYYRPLIKFSFWLDNFIWNFDAFWMHLENIVLHVFNAFLVFWLAHQLKKIAGRTKSPAPLLAALLFGLHPVNSESVNWIAGRSDVLAGFFVLLSANFLLKSRETGSRLWLLISGAAIFPAILTKEVAIAFLPGALAILIAAHIFQGTHPDRRVGNDRDTNRELRFFLIACLIVLTAFFLLRSFGIQKTEFRFGNLINRMVGDPPAAVVVFIQALGFYLKKLVVPVPLNFAILEIDPLHFFLGLPAMALLFVILRSQPMHGAFLVTGIFLLSPALIIAMGKFAWTAYAERYIYVGSAFILPAVVNLAINASSRIPQRGIQNAVRAGVVMYLLFFAAVSLHRSVVWMSDDTLFKDTIEKSPQVLSLRIDYAILLADQGNLDDARHQMAVVREKTQARIELILSKMYNKSFESTTDILFAEAYILEREGKGYESLMKYEELLEAPTKWSVPAAERASMLALAMISRPEPGANRREIKKKLKKFSKMIYNRHMDPQLLYVMGKTFWIQKDFIAAKYYFKMARERFSETNVYRQFSEKMLRNLNGEV